jgi:cellulose synthase/poly-beta-1,6-N-acetylglucosamine synthase-like glycosyltransferase
MICLKIISGVVILLYCLLMLCYRRGWRLQPLHLADSRFQPRTRISIIIPARNEAGRIGECLRALQAQQYPVDLFEAIVVDDHSEDETISQVQAINAPNIRCIRLADHLDPDEPVVAYKKKALAVGIAVSNGELILTTDADCIAPPGWLSTVAALYEREQPVMVIAPVDFSSDGSLVQLFQSIDFMTMQGITAAAHKLRMGNMSNGANLAFSRDAFEKIGGYAGTEHLASGDDFLLTVKMQQAFPGKIAYLKSAEAIVRTAPQPDWRSFLMQRIRWASKSGKYRDTRLTAVQP